MNSRLRFLGTLAFAAGLSFLATARCSGGDTPATDGCVPLNGVCGQATCCAVSSAGDPMVCDADAGACRVQCLVRNHDCTNDLSGCCPGYTCQVDGLGYGTCK